MKQPIERTTAAAGDEISALVQRLLETERRLVSLTSGEVDAVIGPTGQSYLLQNAQEKLKQSEADFRALAEAMPQIVWVTRPDGWTTYFNQQWPNYTGLTLAESLGHGWNKPFHPEDQQRAWDAWRHATATISDYSLECRLRRADGEYRWWLVRGVPQKDNHGRILRWIGTCTDIHAIRQAQEQLRESEDRFRSMFKLAATGIATSTPRGRYLQANAAYCQMLGYTEDELRARDFASVTHPDDLNLNLKLRDELLAGQRPSFVMEKRYQNKNGAIVWTSHSVSATHTPSGEIATLIVVAEDITARKRAQESLQLFQALIDQTNDAIEVVDAKSHRFLYANQSACASLGYNRDELLALSVFDIDKTTTPSAHQQIEHKLETAGHLTFEARHQRKDGSAFPVEVNLKRVRLDKDYVVAVVRDITERKRADARFHRLVESNAQAVIFWNTKGEITDANDAFLNLTRYTREDLKAGRINWTAMTPPEYAELDRQALAELAATGFCTPFDKEFIRKDGTRLPIFIGAATFEDNPAEGVCFLLDRTERVKSETVLRQSEQRFKALFNSAATGIANCTPQGHYLQANAAFCRMLGYTEDELRARDFTQVTHPDDLAGNWQILNELLAGKRKSYVLEKRYLKKSGDIVWTSQSVSAVYTAAGEISMLIIVSEDITERKRLEENFLQAQKMDAIGVLAGGIAHDFNNILAAISGYTELSRMKLTGNPEVRDHLGAVAQATKRATELVRQILTFSRQEVPERKPVKLQPLVAEALTLLRATIPATIDITITIAPDAPTVLADATQIQQILTNLGTNAWHAMKDTLGQIQVNLEKINVDEAHAAVQKKLHTGLYARLSVSDTGCGMDRGTLQKIFEPFFTTKPPGEGTGLGLSVVHGIMNSHDGAITVYSQPGEGTIFHLYFPAHNSEQFVEVALTEAAPRGRGERILFVDDEEMLMQLGQKTLTELGYAVVTEKDPIAAMEMVRAEPARFALVITDETMPGMTGITLAGKLQQIRPDLPVILMTGYSQRLTAEKIEEAGIRQLLTKPTSVHTLGLAVHAALTRPKAL
jgi:PAS domain S-box-containing protein